MSGRKYKNDISDIVGIINACRNNKKDITFQMISTAVENLYGSWDNIEKDMVDILNKVLNTQNLKELYDETIKIELNSHQQLLDFNNEYQKFKLIEEIELV